MIFAAIRSGFAQAWANKRLVLCYYLANFLFGMVLMLPFRSALQQFVGSSLMGENLANRLDIDFLFEFVNENGSQLSGYLLLFPLLLAGYWLVMLFFSGGTFSQLVRGNNFSAPQFWGDAARYCVRFIRLFLGIIPIGIALFCVQFIWNGAQRIFFGSDPYQSVIYWGGWIRVGLRFFSLIVFWMVLDYARIYAISSDEIRMRVALLHGLKLVARNFGVTFGFAVFIFAIGLIALLLYNLVADLLHAPYTIIIILLFLWQQLFMALRMVLKLALYSGEVKLFHHLSSN